MHKMLESTASEDAPESLDSKEEDSTIDPGLAAVLPQGCRVISIRDHGVSFFAQTSRLDVELSDETRTAFFVKVLRQERGKNIVQGEFESLRAIHDVLPDFVPKPIGWGSYETVPDAHFLISEFREMKEEMPRPGEFGALLAALHGNSRSPNGKFGFHTSTFNGNLPQLNDWEDSWEVYFTKSLRYALKLESEANGYNPAIEMMLPVLFDKVIPRLLRPLESDGRSVRPCLVHGDLWHANAGVDARSGKPLVFDACCFYAHNEYEFGQWRPACNRFGPDYLDAYHAYMPKSEPEEDYDGRLDLYKLRFNTHVSALFPTDKKLRKQMLDDIKDLCQRYG